MAVAPTDPLLPNTARVSRASVAGLVLVLAVPALFEVLPWETILRPGDLMRWFLLDQCIGWLLPGALLCLVVLWERRPLNSIGLGKFGVKNVGRAFGFTVLLLAACFLLRTAEQQLDLDQTSTGLARLSFLPDWMLLAFIVRAGVSEEILFRGYAIERLTELVGSRAIGAIIPWAIFTGLHLQFWGVEHLLEVGLLGALHTFFYLRWRDLWANIISHALVDTVLMLPALLPGS